MRKFFKNKRHSFLQTKYGDENLNKPVFEDWGSFFVIGTEKADMKNPSFFKNDYYKH